MYREEFEVVHNCKFVITARTEYEDSPLEVHIEIEDETPWPEENKDTIKTAFLDELEELLSEQFEQVDSFETESQDTESEEEPLLEEDEDWGDGEDDWLMGEGEPSEDAFGGENPNKYTLTVHSNDHFEIHAEGDVHFLGKSIIKSLRESKNEFERHHASDDFIEGLSDDIIL